MTDIIRFVVPKGVDRGSVAEGIAKRLEQDPSVGWFEILMRDRGDDAFVWQPRTPCFLRKGGASSMKYKTKIEVRHVEIALANRYCNEAIADVKEPSPPER